MKNNGISVIERPKSRDQKDREKFFKEIMNADPVAPAFAVYYGHCICGGRDPVFPNVMSGYYYDLGVDISSDDCYPAGEAAMAVGFVEAGIRQMVDALETNSPYADEFMTALRIIFEDDGSYTGFIAEETVQKARSLLANSRKKD